MDTIVLQNIKPEYFVKELKMLKITSEMNFLVTDGLAKNINILIYYLKNQKVKKIIFHKENENLDVLCYRVFSIYLEKWYLTISKDIEILFCGYLDEDLQMLLKKRFYLNYCSNMNIKPKWHKYALKKEMSKIKTNKHLLKYDIFATLVKEFKNFPFSFFNIPNQENYDRFVFYFYMYDENQKNEIINLLNKLNLTKYKKIVSLIKTNKINEEVYGYALGFVYKNNKLKRLTLYSKFTDKYILQNKPYNFLLEKHNLKIDPSKKLLRYYAYDIYLENDMIEIKVYFEQYTFDIEILNKTLNTILYNKSCVRVEKYRNNIQVNEKFEFEFNVGFNTKELKHLKKLGLYDEKYKVLAIYLKKNKIVDKVLYEL